VQFQPNSEISLPEPPPVQAQLNNAIAPAIVIDVEDKNPKVAAKKKGNSKDIENCYPYSSPKKKKQNKEENNPPKKISKKKISKKKGKKELQEVVEDSLEVEGEAISNFKTNLTKYVENW
jgi:hypothetical protein